MDRDQIIERLRERIFRFAACKLSRDAAEDLAQEVLVVLEERYAAVERIEDLLPLSLEIARFKMMAAHRKIARRGENRQVSVDDLPLASSEADPFEQAARQERLARLESVLAMLGERCRQIFRLKLEGYTFPEIHKRLGVALNTLYTWDLRCRKRILEIIDGDGK